MTQSSRDTSNASPRQTKQAQLIKLLKSKSGKDIAALSDALGWQPHTTRAAVSRLRGAGVAVAREAPKSGGPARYRITGTPEA